jgi:hypothetical protein
MIPPTQNSPIPNRSRGVQESLNAVRGRGSIHSRQRSQNRNVTECSPNRVPSHISGERFAEPGHLSNLAINFLVANTNRGEMSTAIWNQIEMVEEISKAFQKTQTLTNKEDDAGLWSGTPMQHFRSGVGARVYLDGLFNELHEYLERKNQIPIPIREKDATLEDVEAQNTAAARLRRSARDLRCWAPAYSTDSNDVEEERSKLKELLKAFASSVRDLRSENFELSRQLARVRQNANTIVGSSIWPVTLRTIIMMRITEANFRPPTRINDQTLLFPKMGNLSPIPVTALDVTLTLDQANQLGHFLPSGAAYSNLYDGIYIQTCIKCCKPKFWLKKANCSPFFCDLNEYPRLNDVQYFGQICSSCGLETLTRAIWRDWWRNLGNIVWLKHDWDQSCCNSWIIDEESLVSVLESLGCQDVNDVDDYVKKYSLPCPS